jgi:hypothetical protein
MGKAKTKILSMIVTVLVPAGTLPGDVHNRMRSVARGVDGYSVKSVKPAGRILAAAAKAFEAWGGGPRPRVSRETPPLLKYMGVE